MGSHLVRILLLRAFSVVLLAAFAVSYNQWPGLLSNVGLTPVNAFLDRVEGQRGRLPGGVGFSVRCIVRDLAVDVGLPPAFVRGLADDVPPQLCLPLQSFKSVPSFFWFVGRADVDAAAQYASAAGLVVSTAIFVTGACAAPAMLLLWALYLSLISVGQDWYGFGWESQLCETAFLIAFACPMAWTRTPRDGVPTITRWLLRWLIARIMIGAGLIKLRGDECWRDLTCMQYFYHTQPVPNPLVGLLHSMPPWYHTLEVIGNHFVELAAPFYLILPQPAAAIGGAIQIAFQLVLISSGNLSFLNWLTLVPAVGALDDRYVRWLFPRSTLDAVDAVQACQAKRGIAALCSRVAKFAVQLALLALIGKLSAPVVENLLSQRQAMNTSFDWLRLVNTYGAFGSVTRDRNEVIVEGRAANGTWYTYEFKCKPGALDRQPCLITPYHYRLDWLMWFAGFSDPQRTGWLLQLANRMMVARKDKAASDALRSLVDHVPFAEPGGVAKSSSTAPEGPFAIRMTLFEYELNDAGKGGRKPMTGRNVEVGRWWRRRKVSREYLPALEPGQLAPVAKHYKVKK